MKIFKNNYGIFTIFNNDINSEYYLENNLIPYQHILEYIAPYILKTVTLIDIGSSTGIRNIYFTKINPSINIYCFEPRQNLYYLLQKNFINNNINNTVIINNMLGHGNGKIKVQKIDKIECDNDDLIEICNGSLIDIENDYMHFITLDGLKLLLCDFIFIDLKGFDYIVFLGGINTIKKYKPVICFINDNEANEIILSSIGIKITSLTNSFDLLKKLDYKFINLEDDYTVAIPNKEYEEEQ